MQGHSEFEEFESNGFLAFDPQIEAATIDAAFAGTRDLYLAENQPNDVSGKVVVFRNNRRIQEVWKLVPAVKAIATAPRVLQLLRDLYGRNPFFRVGFEQETQSRPPERNRFTRRLRRGRRSSGRRICCTVARRKSIAAALARAR